MCGIVLHCILSKAHCFIFTNSPVLKMRFKLHLIKKVIFYFFLMKRCLENFFVYILRLLAGTFGTICTEFPPSNIFAKKFK